MFSRVYGELKRLAASKLSCEHAAHSVNATGLVHDAYLRLAGDDQKWKDRRHFFAVAAESMRRILIDHARARLRLKRRGQMRKDDFHESALIAPVPDDKLLAVSAALEKLAKVDADAAELVKMRYFVGLTQTEIAELLGVSTRTVKRQWSYARAWLRSELSEDGRDA